MTVKAKQVGEEDGLAFPYPTGHEIATRAQQLFLRNGRRVSRLPEYWRKAEAELLTLAVHRWRAMRG